VADLVIRREARAAERRELRRLSCTADALTDISIRVEALSATLVAHGDRLTMDREDPEMGMALYREVVDAFPETEAAATARERLSNITRERNG
jgi:hypothetical protein